MNSKKGLNIILFGIFFLLISSCGLKISLSGKNSKNVISGVVSPLVGSISSHNSFSLFFSTANAVGCTDPVYAKLFIVKNDGSIDESNPIASQALKSNASYSFDTEVLALSKKDNVQYMIKAEGCNDDIYKRPITDFNEKQNLNAKTTIVSEVTNANTLLTTTLNNAKRVEVEALIDSISGASIPSALTSITTEADPIAKFTEIFGVSPTVIQNGKPGIHLKSPAGLLNELAINSFSAQAYHIDPNYSFAYSWKVNGVVKSHNSSWSYIPSANESGMKTIDFYAGKDDGHGEIDLTKPYYTKSFTVFVNNNIQPIPPNISLNSANPSPVATNIVNVDLATGVAQALCASFSHLAITDTNVAPGLMQFTISCANAGSQTENVTFTNTEGNKTLYVWAIDSEGVISTQKTVNLVLDTLPPQASLSFTPTLIKGGITQAVTLSASDDGAGLSTLALYYSATGANPYSLVTNLSLNATSYNWVTPTGNTTTGKLKLTATDLAGRTTDIISSAFEIDSLAPAAPTFTRTSALTSSSTNVTATIGSCTDTDSILINETSTPPLATATGWVACSTLASNYNYIASAQGLHTMYAWAKDTAGNISASANNITMTLDTVNPTIASGPVFPANVMGSSTQNITWSITDATTTTIKIELFNGSVWADLAIGLTNNGSYTWTTTALNVTNAKLRLTATDAAGNTSQNSSADFIIDSVAPIVDLLSLNNGSIPTTNNNVVTTLNAHDATSKIKYFCLKYNDTVKPIATASCWKDVAGPTPGIAANKIISFSGYYFQTGFTKGPSTTYAWVKDESGNISNNTSTLNVDKFAINFDPGTPPVISIAQTTNSNTPGNPITGADLVAPTTGDIYIKWNAADTEGLATNPITLEYTTDDVTFLPVPSTGMLLNASNGSCTVDPGFTGCTKIPSLLNGYYQIRVIAADTLGTTVFLNAAPLNEAKLRLLAGNTDSGLTGSAASAVFNVYTPSGSAGGAMSQNRLAVSDDGKFFYIDKQNGLVWINPINGIVKTFMKTSATSSGENVHVDSAYLKKATAIAMDHKNNLLIWDTDRLRRVDLSTMIITTIIGSVGTVTDPITTVNATDFKLSAFDDKYSSLIPLPNGDIIFTGPITSYHDRKYRAIDQKVELIDLQGTGFTDYPTDSWAASPRNNLGIIFDPNTSAISFMVKGFMKAITGDTVAKYSRIDHSVGNETTPYPGIAPYDLTTMNTSNTVSGNDGNLYLIPRNRINLRRYNPITNTSTSILGAGSYGLTPCNEETLATSCNVSLDSVFISKNGRIYFLDQGKIRTIDDSQKVITLYGQFASYGNGTLASSTRFGTIQDLKLGKYSASNNKLIILDSYSKEYRELTMGSTVSKIVAAGPVLTFEADSATGDIFEGAATLVKRYVRTTSTWGNIIGPSASPAPFYYEAAADGAVGSGIRLSSYGTYITGITNNKLFIQHYGYSAGQINCYLKSYDLADSYRQAHVAGTGACTSTITMGQPMNTQPVTGSYTFNTYKYLQDPTDSVSKYFFTRTAHTKIYVVQPSGIVNEFAALPRGLSSFTYSNVSNNLVFYYCSSGDAKLYKHTVSTNSSGSLSWLSPTIKCKPNGGIIYNPERNSVIFSYTQNGLDGVAEYDLN